MKYGFAITLCATLASGRTSTAKRAGRPMAHSGYLRQGTTPDYSDNWAGAFSLNKGVSHVEGIITIPNYSGGDRHRSIAAWVGIDGTGYCPRQGNHHAGLWQAGFDFYANGRIGSWYEWYPNYSYDFEGFEVKPGDKVKITVDASSTTFGVATLENLTTGKSVSHNSTAPTGSPLCEMTADWIIEDYESGKKEVPIFNFGTLGFTNTTATGSNGSFTVNGGQIIDLEPSNGDKVLTDCEIIGDDLSCRYIG